MITSGDGPVGFHRELLDLLTRLRHQRGGPSLAKISRLASVSKGHLSPIFGGKALPSPQTAVAIAQALGATAAEQARVRRYAEGAAAARSAARGGGDGGGPDGTAVLGEILDSVRSLHTGQPDRVSWPARVGPVPVLASAFRDRAGLREQVTAARTRQGGVMLTQILAGGGGVGKTQLAASYAARAITDGVDLVVWVDATRPEAVPTTYAQAAARVAAPGADGSNADTDARALLDWLSTTTRSWLVVLDDITDPQQVAAWWPSSHTGTGWVLGTTRRRDAALTGGDRVKVDVDGYTEEESIGYLTDRLTDAGATHLLDGQKGRLAAELGFLPLALSHAAAYMINQDMRCAQYLNLYTDRLTRLKEAMPITADTENYGRPVAVTLLLAIDAAQAADPPGLALPALRLAAVLDPAGHPDTLWTSQAVTNYLGAHRRPGPDPASEPGDVTTTQSRAVLRLLHNYALATHTPTAGARAVRVHALTARAAREATPTDNLPAIVAAAADALAGGWPQHDHTDRDLVTALRTNTDTLAAHAGDLLWQPGGHRLLYRAGISFLNTGLYTAAITHWQQVADDALRLLGGDHRDTLRARAWLAASYKYAGRTAEAITIEEQVAADKLRLLGPDHQDTLRARGNLAGSYWKTGRTAEAITIEEQVAADTLRLLGPDHQDTLTARTNLADSYKTAGRTAETITIQEQVAAHMLRLLGPDHQDTLIARAKLAVAYRLAGRTAEAITTQEQVFDDTLRLFGLEHPYMTKVMMALAEWHEADRGQGPTQLWLPSGGRLT